MKALVKAKPQPGIDVVEVKEPGVKPDEVLIAVKAAGICGSDISMYEWRPDYQAWLTATFGRVPPTVNSRSQNLRCPINFSPPRVR